ncbi:SRPBCC family protein [Pseudonocardia kongjuensis]|uniref:SRPBCC family protein n=1 Tax=Pseudonocardia kongjuensis TaxID=102227 RepID=A0ABN1XK46_9PSEU
MIEVRRRLGATPGQVDAVLADGWTYGLWVVGAVHIREVSEDWPKPGARIRHSIGAWPLMIEDRTYVEEYEPGRLLQLRAHAGPAGTARVRLEWEPDGDGSTVRMSEDAIAGPGRLVPPPVRAPLLRLRNGESLARLAAIARGRPEQPDQA